MFLVLGSDTENNSSLLISDEYRTLNLLAQSLLISCQAFYHNQDHFKQYVIKSDRGALIGVWPCLVLLDEVAEGTVGQLAALC